MQASRRRETRRSCLSFRDAPTGRRVAPPDDRLRIADKASGHPAIGHKKEINKATWRKPRGIRCHHRPCCLRSEDTLLSHLIVRRIKLVARPIVILFFGEAEVAWSRVCSFTDPSACQTVFQTADVELFPTAKGIFHAEVTQIGINRVLIHRARISLPGVNTVALKHGRKSIGFLTEPNSAPLWHCDFEVLPGDIVVNRCDVAHQRSGANFCYGDVTSER
jgi:hypothetical protein